MTTVAQQCYEQQHTQISDLDNIDDSIEIVYDFKISVTISLNLYQFLMKSLPVFRNQNDHYHSSITVLSLFSHLQVESKSRA